MKLTNKFKAAIIACISIVLIISIILLNNNSGNIKKTSTNHDELISKYKEQINILEKRNKEMEEQIATIEEKLKDSEDDKNIFKEEFKKKYDKYTEEELEDSIMTSNKYQISITGWDGNSDDDFLNGSGKETIIENSGVISAPSNSFYIKISRMATNLFYAFLIADYGKDEWYKESFIGDGFSMQVENYDNYHRDSSSGGVGAEAEYWVFKNVEIGTKIDLTIPEELEERLNKEGFNFDSNEITITVD